MKKILVCIIALIIIQGCSITYYNYYTVDSTELATQVSMQDAVWSPNKKTPTRCIAVFVDSTGKATYVMESKSKEKLNKITE